MTVVSSICFYFFNCHFSSGEWGKLLTSAFGAAEIVQIRYKFRAAVKAFGNSVQSFNLDYSVFELGTVNDRLPAVLDEFRNDTAQ